MRLFSSFNTTRRPFFSFDACLLLFYRRPQFFAAAVAVATLLLFHWAHTGGGGAGGAAADRIYETTPMCDPITGACGEDADHPSPRTVFSARSRDQCDRWWRAHTRLNATAARYDAALLLHSSDDETNNKNHNQKPLILLGDSITESWIGTNMGFPERRAREVPPILQKRLVQGGGYHPLVLAIGGDQTQHLLYRLQHGELPPRVRQHPGATFVVLIGTNNLGSGMLPEPTARGVQAVAEYLLEETAGRVVVQLVLPRGDNFRLRDLCPPRCASDGNAPTANRKPLRSFLPAIEQVNHAVRTEHRDELRQLHPGRFDVVDCSAPFLEDESKQEEDGSSPVVKRALMPDYLHPNAAGHELLATCLLDCLQEKTCSFAA